MRRALSFGTESALAAAAPAMLVRALLALVVGCVALVVACTDDDTATDMAPELREQQAAVEIEQEQERSSERGEAAPASAAETTHETQSNEIQDSAEPADSETSEKPETESDDAAASQSASDNPPAESGDQTATEQTATEQAAAVESEPEPSVAQAQSQQAPVEAETQSEPEPAQQAQDADNNVREEAEETHVAQPPATDPDPDPDVDTEEEQTSRVAPTPVGSGDNVGGSSAMTEDEPAGQQPLDASPQKGAGETDVVTVSTANTYTWQDGDYTRTVTHQADLTATAQADGGSEIGPRQAGGAQSDPNPVFQSDTGETMTLPGGVLLVLDAEWNQARIDQFFKDNNVDRSLVQERTFTTNAYFIETEPGFPSLNLANELVAQEGVVFSSPNWQTEVELQ